MREWLVALTIAAAPGVTPPAFAAGIDSAERLAIRTYDAASLDAARRDAALATAARILEAAGVAVEWVVCDIGGVYDGSPRCASREGTDDLIVRFVQLPPSGRAGRWTLGHALVDTGSRSGALATIFVDRVMALVGTSGVSIETTLGRAMAHEIGHLLLGHARHADSGLMRAVWTVDSLRLDAPADWLFSPADVRALRASILARSARPQAARLAAQD